MPLRRSLRRLLVFAYTSGRSHAPCETADLRVSRRPGSSRHLALCKYVQMTVTSSPSSRLDVFLSDFLRIRGDSLFSLSFEESEPLARTGAIDKGSAGTPFGACW